MADIRQIEIVCTADEDGITADDLLRRRGVSRRTITLLKRTENGITRNNILCRSIDRVSAGDIILLNIPERSGGAEPNPALQVAVVYEDDDIIVYNKPFGMPVHQSMRHYTDTLANFFAVKYPNVPFRAVNRLDRDTSGLCIAAKNRLGADIRTENIRKTYYAVCEGVIDKPIRIDAPIAREYESMIKRVVREDGQRAVTNAVPLCSDGRHTLMEIHLETGRTHQIRVHFAHIGHPLAGDDLYGGSREYISRQALHCGRMEFEHPVTSKLIEVSAAFPQDVVELIQLFGCDINCFVEKH